MRQRARRRRTVVVLMLALVMTGLPASSAAPGWWRSGAHGFTVGELTFHFVDRSRSIRFPGHHRQARPVTTEVLYPIVASDPDTPQGVNPAAAVTESFPLVVFGHGFNVTPATYTTLLEGWVRAGYVVAAPVFPLGNRDAPGGANEADLSNQPTDMSFVITQLLRATRQRHGILSGLIDTREVAVAGQSDGGSTALAVAYNRSFTDHRVRAAVILSGARIPRLGGYVLGTNGPTVLAVQGTADPLNAPASTYHYFNLLRPPKFLLRLWGAGHLSPYTTNATQRTIVTRVSVAFMDRYLKRRPDAAREMSAAGNVRGVATLTR